MTKTLIVNLFLLNHGIGNFTLLDPDMIPRLVVIGILVHLLCIATYFTKSDWLKVLGTIIYFPFILILVIISVFATECILFLLGAILFFYLTVVRTRK